MKHITLILALCTGAALADPVKVSELPAAGALTGAEQVMVVQDGASKRAPLSGISSLRFAPYPGGANDDEFETAGSPGGAWSWIVQSSATATVTDGQLKLSVPASPTGLRLFLRAAPSGNWRIETKLHHDHVPIGDATSTYAAGGAGLYIRNSSNSRGFAAYVIYDNGWRSYVHSWSSNSAINSGEGGYGFIYPQRGNYLRIEKQGTDYRFYFSYDGHQWYLMTTETISTYVGAVDQVGFCTLTSVAILMYADYFRVTALP
jgi:hypothetical protein